MTTTTWTYLYDVAYSSKRLTPNDPLIVILKFDFFFKENELCVGVLQWETFSFCELKSNSEYKGSV